jgi:cystathionine gamma-synthase
MSDGFSTRAIHAGQGFDPATGAVVPPLHLSSTFVQDGVGGLRGGYEYGRAGNPTRDVLQAQLAALEGGARALSFASGLAAEDAVLRAALKPGDHLVLAADAYGGTNRLVTQVYETWGVRVTTLDLNDTDAVREALQTENTRVLWAETPSNPLLKITDIALLAELAHEAGALAVVDNTFASPALQRPISLGTDVVVHSTTKYLGGHSDVIGGAVVIAPGHDELAQAVAFQQFGVGAVSSPFDAYLTSRGIKTLEVRMRQHCANAQAVAEVLAEHPRVEQVFYPGLPSHPGHDLAARQMSGFGGMLSVAVSGGAESARRFAESTRVFQLAESLGGVESLISYPSEMSHASLRGTPLAVADNVVRISVGIETVDDLVADVLQAVDRVRP